MREFNYKRAWKEWANPLRKKLMKVPEYVAAWDKTVELSPKIRQTERSTQRPRLNDGEDDELAVPAEFPALLSKLGESKFREAAYVTDMWGHWGSLNEVKKTHGATWKFRIFCGYLVPGVHECASFNTDEFMDHKPGSGFDQVETASILSKAILGSKLTVEGVISANFKVNGEPGHPFVIGRAHFPQDGGRFIDVHQAGCCQCLQPYESHTHDEVVMIRGSDKVSKEELHHDLLLLKKYVEIHNTNNPTERLLVDGFRFPDGIPQ
jgi:hypothetical protein